MSQELRVEFKMAVAGRRPAPKPKPTPEAKTERRRVDRATRKARNLALAYHINNLIHSEQVADLATMARLCSISRARISMIVGLLGLASAEQERILRADMKGAVPPGSSPLPRSESNFSSEGDSSEQKAPEPD